MNRKTRILTAIFLFTGISFFSVAAPKPPVVSEATLLREMTDRDALARLPYPAYKTRQFSSYDRKAVSPGPARVVRERRLEHVHTHGT